MSSFPRFRKLTAWRAAAVAVAAVAVAGTLLASFDVPRAGAAVSIEAVDRTRFRVCADPSNLPFSNDKGEGFENKIAELFAKKLGRPLVYYYWPQLNQFVLNTLAAKRCDLIMGINANSDEVLNTNPYYRTAYVMVYPKSLGVELKGLDDPVIKEKKFKIGAVVETPPGFLLVHYKLLDQLRSYPLRYNPYAVNMGQAMIDDLTKGVTQIALMSSPLAGYWARKEGLDAEIVPLKSLNQTTGKMDFLITMGVRRGENDWKRLINELIRQNQAEINKILTDYGVLLYRIYGEPEPLVTTKAP
jgi:quinoprotein dehydrogenase-associated probable ABC transporter substrate-binding protein